MYKIYTFWTDTNLMSEQRKRCLESLQKNSDVEVVLVTYENLSSYIIEPLHPAYYYLSAVHKADYLRTYFMNFYGGGYSDIKETTSSWKESFNTLSNSDKWMIGYKEINGGVAYQPYVNEWKELIGNCAYICKPQTPLTKEWYSEMLELLDNKLERLKLNPATQPRDCSEASGGKYPIEWNEMLGRIFHKINYKHKDMVLNTLPLPKFNNYL